MAFNEYSALRAHRLHFLDLAVKDTKKWCVLPDQLAEPKKPSDQHWIRLFATAASRPVTKDDAKAFLITFMLIRASWKLENVASAINLFAGIETLEPTSSIEAFAKQLRKLNALERRQTSAASKIANFAYPRAQVYIWDALATKSARLRDKERSGSRSRALGIYKEGAEHDYAAFHAACALAHEEERAKPDFLEAVAHLDAYFQAQGGPMANRDDVPLGFIERRLLDKLMFWEGWAVDRKTLPAGL
jgi:hypothetical protein